ncbi:MAG: DNA translocase FtsK [Phycisphaerales bacterium]|nr:DNA translocase FtsK [Phycisphaerales bacterium]
MAQKSAKDAPSSWHILQILTRGPTKGGGGDSLVLRRLGWAILLGMLVFLTAALVSHDPADPPGVAVWPQNVEIQNWCGHFGALVAHYGLEMLDAGVWVLLGSLVIYLIATACGRAVTHPAMRIIGVLLIATAVAGGHHMLLPTVTSFPHGAGGLIGVASVRILSAHFGTIGTGLILTAAVWIGAIVAFDRLLYDGARAGASIIARLAAWVGRRAGRIGRLLLSIRPRRTIRLNDVDDDTRLTKIPDRPDVTVVRRRKTAQADIDDPDQPAARAQQKVDKEALREKIAKLPLKIASAARPGAPTPTEQEPAPEPEPEQDLSGYRFPTLDMLEDPEGNFTEKMESFVREQAQILEEALNTYNINGEVVGIDSGPVITMYEVQLVPGTKVASLTSVSSDIARAMGAINIRVVPNIAGKKTVGIEVPNIEKEMVRLKELMLACPNASHMKLPMFLGKDASGAPITADLTKMPHMLIAGTTGSGKSVCMNSIIMSFLYTKRPDELKLVLVDPKMVEMSQFRDIPHLMCPVVTEMSKAVAILEWAVAKMDERYELLAEVGCRNVAAYNSFTWEELKDRLEPKNEEEEARIPRHLPYMVFVIDELADMMMTNKDVEHAIVRLAQKSRAVGLHLILATQRPQANVVTGLIKSNMPCRIAFKVSSGMDSRIVLDQKGAELLLGQGDMLYLSPRSHDLVRCQGTLVGEGEIRRSVKFLKSIAVQSFERQLVQIRSPQQAMGDEGIDDEITGKINERDPLFEKAVEMVIASGRGSVSMLQRSLSIGYTRSSRLIEQMGQAGIIGDYKGSQARDVVTTIEEWEAMKKMMADEEGDGTLFEGATPKQVPTRPSLAQPQSSEPSTEAVDDADAVDAHDEDSPDEDEPADAEETKAQTDEVEEDDGGSDAEESDDDEYEYEYEYEYVDEADEEADGEEDAEPADEDDEGDVSPPSVYVQGAKDASKLISKKGAPFDDADEIH